MNVTNLKVKEIVSGIKGKEFSAVEVVNAYIDTIEKKEKEINAYITLTIDLAMEMAKKVDEKIKRGEKVGRLAGVPIAIKDNINIKDITMTCGSKMLENYIPPYTATIVEKIIKEDGIIIGKTNLDEFAMGTTTETSYFGVTKNPLNTDLVAGGSSGGSAAAVAAGEALVAIGTDTGGSIRQPASFCGTVGIKPTYGTSSRYGVTTMANTFDQNGVLARNIEDAVELLKVIEGEDAKDATSLGNSSIKALELDKENPEKYLQGLKIAIPEVVEEANMGPEVREIFEQIKKQLEAKGAVLERVKMDSLQYGMATYHIIANGELAPNMARYDGLIYGYRSEDYEDVNEMFTKSRTESLGNEVKKRIMIGTHIMSMEFADEYYKKALQIRTLMKKDFDRIFKEYDLILSPTTPNLPFEIQEKKSVSELYNTDLFTVWTNITGIGAISIPVKTEENLSVGIQFMCNSFADDVMIKAAYGLERSLG